MSIITLTSDLGTKDFYVGAVKGAIYSQCPDAVVVDITHNIGKFNISQAAFIVKNVYNDFPKGTIHILSVQPEPTSETPHVGIKYDGHYFIGADNGIFSLIFDQTPENIVELTISTDTDIPTFPTKDVFVKAACHLSRGGTLEVIGGKKDAVVVRSPFRPVVDGKTIRGSAIYIDSYGNIVTNITKQLFQETGKEKPFSIQLRRDQYAIRSIKNSYNEVPDGEMVALFSANGFLEISMNRGNASELLGISENDIIRIEFE